MSDANFLLLIIVIFIISVLAIVCLYAHSWKVRKKKFKKSNSVMSYTFSSFKGLGNEPVWNGTLPESVEYDGIPRYVYEDLYESTNPSPEHGMVIGYRIGPELVIHNMVASNKCCTNESAKAFLTHYKGKALTLKDAYILTAPSSWEAINKLRTQIGDTPLPKGCFWINNIDCAFDGIRVINDYIVTANMIMKR